MEGSIETREAEVNLRRASGSNSDVDESMEGLLEIRQAELRRHVSSTLKLKTMPALKVMCKTRTLRVGGKKSELVERLTSDVLTKGWTISTEAELWQDFSWAPDSPSDRSKITSFFGRKESISNLDDCDTERVKASISLMDDSDSGQSSLPSNPALSSPPSDPSLFSPSIASSSPTPSSFTSSSYSAGCSHKKRVALLVDTESPVVKRKKNAQDQSFDPSEENPRRPHLTRRALKASLRRTSSGSRRGSDFFTKMQEAKAGKSKELKRKKMKFAASSASFSPDDRTSSNIPLKSLPNELLSSELRRDEADEKPNEDLPGDSGHGPSAWTNVDEAKSGKKLHSGRSSIISAVGERKSQLVERRDTRDDSVTPVVPISLIRCSSLRGNVDVDCVEPVSVSATSTRLLILPRRPSGPVLASGAWKTSSTFQPHGNKDPYEFQDESPVPHNRRSESEESAFDSQSVGVSSRSPSIVATVTADGVPIAIVTTQSEESDSDNESRRKPKPISNLFGSQQNLIRTNPADVMPVIEWIKISEK